MSLGTSFDANCHPPCCDISRQFHSPPHRALRHTLLSLSLSLSLSRDSGQIRLRRGRSCGQGVRRGCVLYERPTLQRFHHEVFSGCERLVPVRAARLCPALVQVPVQPKSEFSTGKAIRFYLLASGGI